MKLDQDDAAAIAAAVVDELRGAVVPAVIPARIGEYFRYCASGYRWQQFIAIPSDPVGGLYFHLSVRPDGSLDLALERVDGGNQPFWRGTLRPADQPPRRLADEAGAELGPGLRDEAPPMRKPAGSELGAGLVGEAPRRPR